NPGLSRMAEACGIGYDVLRWTQEWYVREETLREAHAGPLLSARWNEDLITECWPDLLRMAGSLKYGQATASLVVGKWSAASRQNTLAAALKEWGMLRRTLHAAKYLSDPARPTAGRSPGS
ncbi:Tn3 family transposase, partial [Nonomuraea sp. NPDC049028]|uniref:Tn3 family transposase n=1 Tax=Nonomuraea sp. NPDC049028 TaxID=3364348 RepID=UPI0037178151